jgi:hypothetical protein
VEDDGPPFDATLLYADCTADEADTGSPKCRHVVEIEDGAPAPGEISTQGGCTFTARVQGATVALFRVNPTTLRVFLRGATVYVSAGSRALDLAATRALRGLNAHVLRSRPVSVGPCHAPPPKPAVHLTAKQRYERAMKGSFTIASASALRMNIDRTEANPAAVAREFVRDARTFPMLLRNEALRVAAIHPPAAVAPLQRRLVAEVRTYAADVDSAVRLVRAGAWKRADWNERQRKLEATFAGDAGRIAGTVRAFRRAGYAVASGPGH